MDIKFERDGSYKTTHEKFTEQLLEIGWKIVKAEKEEVKKDEKDEKDEGKEDKPKTKTRKSRGRSKK